MVRHAPTLIMRIVAEPRVSCFVACSRSHPHSLTHELLTIWTLKHKSNLTRHSSMLPWLGQLQRCRRFLIDMPISMLAP